MPDVASLILALAPYLAFVVVGAVWFSLSVRRRFWTRLWPQSPAYAVVSASRGVAR